MTQNSTTKTVVVCDTEPLAIEGLRALIAETEGLRLAGAISTLAGATGLVRSCNPSVVILDRAFGTGAVIEVLDSLHSITATHPVVWGVGISNADTLRLVQAGAKGVVQKTSETQLVIECIRTVASGENWMEDTLLQGTELNVSCSHSNLTAREHQVVKLVEKGLKNKDIALSLGIQTGTVKIHMKHIFEKTGCHGRYRLALTGLREKGYLPVSL